MTNRIVYEAEPIPPRDPNDGNRQKWSAIFGAFVVITVLLAGVAFGAALFRGNDGPEPLADPDSSRSTVTRSSTTLGSPLADRSRRSQGAYGSDGAESRPYSPGADVGPPTPPLPRQDFTWQRVTLDLPEGDDAYLQGVYAVDDGFVALGMSSSSGANQAMVLWKSTDGVAWDKAELTGDFSDANVWNVVFTDHGAIAFGEQWVDYEGHEEISFREHSPVRLIWTSPDGITWTRTELDLATAENQEVWINTGVVGPDGYLIMGQRSTSPEFEPLIIEKDGYRLELSEYSYTYRLLDPSATVVTEGSMEEIYSRSYDEDGQVIAHPETGEILTIIPWEAWERAWEDAYSESTGGPFGGYAYSPSTLTIEHDGYRIIMDEEASTYLIEDVATGEIIASGSSDYLWRGPAPVITDDAGSEIISFTWEEFDAAQEAFWEERELAGYDYRSDVVVAVSTDGVTWTEAVIESDGRELSFESIIVRDGGYLAYGNQYDDFGGGPVIWTSPDGLRWEHVADMPGGMYIWNVKATSDGSLIAMGDGPQGAALWSTTDGVAWSEAFPTRIPEDRTLSEWFSQVGTGRLGTVIVGSREHSYPEEEYYSNNPLTLTQGDFTLAFDDYDWPPRVTVTDNVTDDVVIEVRLAEAGGLPEGFSYEDGVTSIAHNGAVLLAITDEEWSRAQEERWMALEETFTYQAAQPTMYFSTDLGTWTDVPLEFEGWFGHIAVGANAVVLAGEEYFEEPHLLEPESEYGEGYVYRPPAPVLFVGRP